MKSLIVACRIQIRMFYKENEQFKKELGFYDESQDSFQKPDIFRV